MMSFRQVEPGDFEELTRFFTNNNTREVLRKFNPFPLTEATAREICRSDQLDRYFVARVEGEVVGLSMLRGWSEGFVTPSLGILVDRSRTGKGLGRQMTEATLAEARKAGCGKVRLSVYASNTAAVSLYQSLGFVESDAQPVVIPGERDVKDVKIVMTKALERP